MDEERGPVTPPPVFSDFGEIGSPKANKIGGGMKKSGLLFSVFFVPQFFVAMPVFYASEPSVSALSEDAVSAEEVRAKQAQKVDFVLFDARGVRSYESEHIEGAILPLVPEFYESQKLFQAHVISAPPNPDGFLGRSMERYPRDTKIVTYCNKGCQASQVLMTKLKALGFSDVKFIPDGIDAWKEKGYPVITKEVTTVS